MKTERTSVGASWGLGIGLVLVALLGLCGCSQSPVADQVTQQEANELVAMLDHYGIQSAVASSTGSRGRYEVLVASDFASQARILMQANGLPRSADDELEKVLEPKGLLPNTREMEQFRLDRAMSLEVEKLLEQVPLVKRSRVVIRSQFRVGGEPSASIVVQHADWDPTFDAAAFTKKMREAISPVLGSINPEKVHFQLIPVSREEGFKASEDIFPPGPYRLGVPLVPFLKWWKIPGWNVPADERRSLYFLLFVLSISALIAGTLVGYFLGFSRQSRKYFEGEQVARGGPVRGPVSEALRVGSRDKEV